MRVNRFVLDANIWVSYLITALTYPIRRYIPTDKDDDYLIALALQTSSGFITSGDKNILSEKERLEKKFKKIKILTKAEFEAMFLK